MSVLTNTVKLTYVDGRFRNIYSNRTTHYPKVELCPNGTIRVGCCSISRQAFEELRRLVDRGEPGFVQDSSEI
jgi:hypothetical protein